MDFLKKIKDIFCSGSLPGMIILSFLLWVFSFRHFLSGELVLAPDAASYYSHIKFYVDNILNGVYPLWNAPWDYGLPNEFFLRRIGAFNPFLFLIIILRKIGVPHLFSYLTYLTVYYFVGMIGFYLLAKRIFRDEAMAFVAFLLLMFSSLGTRNFDSYIMLTFVPAMWFFTFLVAFTQQQKKKFFLGLIFSVMVAFTTYIPFYFVTIFFSFVVCFMVVCWRDLKGILMKYCRFLTTNKIFVVLCLLALLLALLPGFLFFQETGRGELVFPWRHYDYSHTAAPGQNEMTVDIHNITKWGGLEDIVYSMSFLDLRKFKFAVIYIPIFAYILFFLGIFTLINKRLILFAAWALVLFLISAPYAPFHQFLYDRIFFFKYFRNLHFFLWITLLPVFVLFVVEQFRMFLNYHSQTQKRKYASWVFLILIHIGFGVFLHEKGNAVVSSYVVLVLSLIFFILHSIGMFQGKKALLFMFLLALVVAQPLEVYHYLGGNVHRFKPRYPDGYPYDKPYLDFSFTRWGKVVIRPGGTIKQSRKYVGLKWNNFLSENMWTDVLREYARHRFIVYDNIRQIEEGKEIGYIKQIGRVFLENRNIAFVSVPAMSPGSPGRRGRLQAQKINENSEQFQVLQYDSNSIKVRTNFDSRKFLVYNDNFHSQWRAFINGKKADLFRANVAFKGLWIPAGENIVYLRYGARMQYFIEILLLGIFYFTFLYLAWLMCREHRHGGVSTKGSQ